MNDVQGLEALQKKLAALGKTKAKAAIRKGTRAGAKIVQAKLKASTPIRSGAAAKAIKVRAMRRSRKYVGTTARYERPKGANILYIAVVNYGSAKRGIPAKRFMNEAARKVRSEAVDEAVQIIAEEIQRA